MEYLGGMVVERQRQRHTDYINPDTMEKVTIIYCYIKINILYYFIITKSIILIFENTFF